MRHEGTKKTEGESESEGERYGRRKARASLDAARTHQDAAREKFLEKFATYSTVIKKSGQVINAYYVASLTVICLKQYNVGYEKLATYFETTRSN